MAPGDPSGAGVSYTTKELFAEIHQRLGAIQENISQRFHSLKGDLAGISLRLTSLEGRVTLLEDDRPALRQMAHDFDVGQEVRKALWGKWQRLAAVCVFLFALIGAIGTAVSLYLAVKYGSRP